MKTKQLSHIMRFLVGIVITMVIIALTPIAQAQQYATDRRIDKFFFGAALGVQTDTPDSTAYAIGLYGDYYLTRGLSIGPLFQMGITGDLMQLGLTAQTKYTFDLPEIPQLKPHVQAGLGFIYANLDKGSGGSENDTSYLIPFGVGAEYKLTNSISLDTTILFNITNLDVGDEDFFVTWLIGLKFAF
jgi:opacity protein-like surface antigen